MESKASLSLTDCISFVDFEAGKSMGQATVMLEEELVNKWCSVFPGDADSLPFMPEGMSSVLVMRAYMEILSPRPPGNVHAGQSFKMYHRINVGDCVTTELVCKKKWESKGRNWIELESASHTGSGVLAFTGVMTMIWAV